MNKLKKIIISAGEESGDMYGANIINYFTKNIDIYFYAMGSNKIKNTSAEIILDSSDLSVVGFFEVIKIYPKLLRSLNIMKKSIDIIKPDLIILIDYQEFNMKLAKYAKSKGVKVLFYISPQVWAWRENRIKNIINNIDIMAVIFPFEKRYYEQFGIETHYVGHPLVESKGYKIGNFKKNNYIGFFPGSRVNEVRKHLPIIKKVIKKISKKYPDEKFLISKSSNIDMKLYENFFMNEANTVIVENDNIYKTIGLCKSAVAASGTITLQIGLMKIPVCVLYKLSNLTYYFAKFLIKTKYISLINIVLQKFLVKEFVQHNASYNNIFIEIEKLTFDKNYRNNIIKEYGALEEKLLNDDLKININSLITKILKI